MGIERVDLDAAVGLGIVSHEQAEALWGIVAARHGERSSLTFQHMAYYAGALVVIGAMGWHVTEAWGRMTGLGFLLTAFSYAAVFLWAGARLSGMPGARVPGGLLVTLAVCMTPMAVYGIELMTDFWPQGGAAAYPQYWTRVRSAWLFMEAATVLAGLLALRRFRFPFLAAPIALALWFMSMDLAPLLLDHADFTWRKRSEVSIWFGLAMLLATCQIDRRTREDFAFWGYLFGLLAFWGGLTSLESSSEIGRLGYCGVNILLLVAAILLERRVFLVFGGVGASLYLGHLAHRVFKDSLAFPFVLSALGLGVMALGWAYQRHRPVIDAAVLNSLPAWAIRSLPRSRRP